MYTSIVYLAFITVLTAIVVFTNRKYGALRDNGTIPLATYSYSRVQLAWWLVIILSSLFTIIFIKKAFPSFDESILMLGGLTGAVSVVSTASEKGTKTDNVSKGLFADILNGGDPHRLQIVLLNAGVGLFFVYQVFNNLSSPSIPLNFILPTLPNKLLEFMGISGSVYIGFKQVEK